MMKSMKYSISSVFVGLPDLFFQLVPKLKGLSPPEESRADCERCPMTCQEEELAQKPFHFLPNMRCCTYHPLLFNWQVGQILLAGGRSKELMLNRLAERDGVGAYCIQEPARLEEYRIQNKLAEGASFGRNMYFRCPYWVGGKLSCGIWKYRNAVCRTWFCKYEDGPRSFDFWYALQKLLRNIEEVLAGWCMENGKPPKDAGSLEELQDWYIWCYQWITQTALDKSLVGQEINSAVVFTKKLRQSIDRTIPDLLAAQVEEFEDKGNQVLMQGYSPYDKLLLPKTIFAFLCHLNGETTWQEALAKANSGLTDENKIPPVLIEELYKRGLLAKISGPEDLQVGLRASIWDGTTKRHFTPQRLHFVEEESYRLHANINKVDKR